MWEILLGSVAVGRVGGEDTWVNYCFRETTASIVPGVFFEGGKRAGMGQFV
jgi:hypothetical protein